MFYLYGGSDYWINSKRKEQITMWDMLKKIMEFVSPELRKLQVDFVLDLEAKAAATPNPWDDVLVFVLKKM